MSTTQVHEATPATDEKPAVPPPAYSGPAPQTTTAAAATTASTGDIAPAPVAQPSQQPTQYQNRTYESFNEPAKPEEVRMQYAPVGPQDDDAKHHAPSGGARLVLPLANLQDRPVEVDCPYCRRVTMTRVEEHSSGMTILAGVLVGFFCICLACLPCIMHTCADVDHFCSNCNRQLTHRPYEGTTAVVAQGGMAGGPPPGAVPSKYAEGNSSQPPPQQQNPNGQWLSSSTVQK